MITESTAERSSPTLRPMPLWQSALYFGAPSLLTMGAIYWLMAVAYRAGAPRLACLLVMAAPLVLMFFAALIAYRLEGRPWDWQAFKERYRLRRMTAQDWLWAAGLTAFHIGSYIGLEFTGAWLEKLLWGPPEILGLVFGDNPNEFAGIPLKGQWFLAAFYAGILFFNIFGEELWWRGLILPRQELTHGKATWAFHGVLWTLFHIFWAWNLLKILPGALALSYVVQRRQNTWIGIISHSCLNGLGLVQIVMGIVG